MYTPVKALNVRAKSSQLLSHHTPVPCAVVLNDFSKTRVLCMQKYTYITEKIVSYCLFYCSYHEQTVSI